MKSSITITTIAITFTMSNLTHMSFVSLNMSLA